MIYQESEGTWEGPINGTPAFRPPETITASGRLTRKVSQPSRLPSLMTLIVRHRLSFIALVPPEPLSP